MELNTAIKEAYDKNAVLFLGSGFSTGGVNMLGLYMKTGKELSHAICKDLNIEMSDDLSISADRYINDDSCKKGVNKFIEFLKKECICKEASPEQEIIASLNWRRIYTTNYDNTMEVCSKKLKINRKPITITNRRYKVSQNLEQAIIHINGFIETVTSDTFFDEFKITDDSYTRDGFLESSWRNLFENDLQNAKAIIFIGYSLQYDQDIVKCISQLSVKDKCLFIDINKISSDITYKMKKYGKLETIGVEGFAKAIKYIGKTYTPNGRIIKLRGIEKILESKYVCTEEFSSADVFNLLSKGILKYKFISRKNYCIHRNKAIIEIKKKISQVKLLILQSYLGNGKTTFLECLANDLIPDYQVYFLKKAETFEDDINLIQGSMGKESKSVLLIDDGDKYRNILRRLGKDFPENMTLIITCRTTINMHFYYNMIEDYGFSANDIYTYDLDKLNNGDVSELISVLNHSHLWGKFDRLSNSQKRKKIEEDYHNELSQIFYLLLDSSIIKNEIEKVIFSLRSKIRLREFILAQAINSVCQLKFSYSDICKFVNVTHNELINFNKDDVVKEILAFKDAEFLIRSPIYLQYLISKLNIKKEIVDILSQLFKKCSYNDYDLKRYENQRRTMISRADILSVVSVKGELSKNDENYLFDYYDGIKDLSTTKNNPFFWLQFAITTLNIENYNLAEVYFQTAYANAKQTVNFTTYQIDTHYARLLLMREIRTNRNNKGSALDVFYKAHELLYDNSRMGKLDYSLRQTGIYNEYFVTYQNLMTEEEKDYFIRTAAQFIDRFIDYFTDNLKGTYNVRNAYKEFRKLFKNSIHKINIVKCDEILDRNMHKRQH